MSADRGSLIRPGLGVLASVYGLYGLVGLYRAVAQSGHHVHTVVFWPTWLVTSGMCLTAAVCAALVVGGVGTAVVSWKSMRLLLAALIAEAAMTVAFRWSSLIGLGLGWIPVSLPELGTGPAKLTHSMRVFVWLQFVGSVLAVLVASAAALWTRREIGRTARRD